MLSVVRREAIMNVLETREVASIQQLMDAAQASESTIRRDLIELESEQQLKRVHGGASLLKSRKVEPTVAEKTTLNSIEKQAIAKHAAQSVEQKACIYLDAGTTTYELIPFLINRDVVVVTNGIQHVQRLMECNIETYLTGGKVKQQTGALIGAKAIEGLRKYRFDRAFLGMNGVDVKHGFTTPDPEEASLKETVLRNSTQAFVLADHTKINEVSFATVAPLHEATIITSDFCSEEELERLREYTKVEAAVQ